MLLFCLVVLTFTEAVRQFYFQMPVFILHLLIITIRCSWLSASEKDFAENLNFLKESIFGRVGVGLEMLFFFFFPFQNIK